MTTEKLKVNNFKFNSNRSNMKININRLQYSNLSYVYRSTSGVSHSVSISTSISI